MSENYHDRHQNYTGEGYEAGCGVCDEKKQEQEVNPAPRFVSDAERANFVAWIGDLRANENAEPDRLFTADALERQSATIAALLDGTDLLYCGDVPCGDCPICDLHALAARVRGEKMSYNGWSNYETWNVALWIDNEPDSYAERCELAKNASNENALADHLKAWITGAAPDLGASVYSDLLSAALSEVNWYEIAENWYAEAHEGETQCSGCDEWVDSDSVKTFHVDPNTEKSICEDCAEPEPEQEPTGEDANG